MRHLPLALGLVLATPGLAHAYSELARFAEPAVEGGGDGRYFTGAPTDGHACSVCHGGAAAAAVTVEGLPDRITAGTRYDLSLSWPDDGRTYALALELVDDAGNHPAVTVPPLAQQPAGMKCAQPAGTAAVATVDLGGRRVVSVAPCGARRLELTFTPSSDRPLYFGVGAVASDQQETPEHDGVFELRRDLSAGSGGCSAGGAPAGGATGLLLVAGLLRRRRRR